jgi:hypothetical protein
MKWYNVYYEDRNGCWHSAKSQAGITNLNSLEEAQNCAKYIEQYSFAKQIRIKCITEEVVETYFVRSKEDALKEELVYLAELRECTKSLWYLYAAGPLKDSNKVSWVDLSLANINNSITEVNQKLKELSSS